MVPSAGLEPARPLGQRILSPLRLPIPPGGLFFVNQWVKVVCFLINRPAFSVISLKFMGVFYFVI